MDLDLVRQGLIIFLLLVASVSIHEWAHAWVADRLGDDTPRLNGRLTLNPMAHIDPFGTVIMPLINIFYLRGLFSLFGWGRPVPTTPANFAHRNRDEVLVCLAGPAANLCLALLATVLGVLIIPALPLFAQLVHLILVMNVGLAVFNLLPLPPLDGGTLVRHVTGMSEEAFRAFSRWSTLAILLLLLFTPLADYLGTAFAYACVPFHLVGSLLNPRAALVLFSS